MSLLPADDVRLEQLVMMVAVVLIALAFFW
jgi:hypothetical protein